MKEVDISLAPHERYTSRAQDACLLGPVHRTWRKTSPYDSSAPAVYPNGDRLDIKNRLHGILADVRKDPGVEGRSDNVEFLIAWWSRPENKSLSEKSGWDRIM